MLPQASDGFAIPAADLLCDALCECELLDPEWADPLDWPAWTDQRFALGPDPNELRVERTAWNNWLATRAEPQP
jgi:hypothetical protein